MNARARNRRVPLEANKDQPVGCMQRVGESAVGGVTGDRKVSIPHKAFLPKNRRWLSSLRQNRKDQQRMTVPHCGVPVLVEAAKNGPRAAGVGGGGRRYRLGEVRLAGRRGGGGAAADRSIEPYSPRVVACSRKIRFERAVTRFSSARGRDRRRQCSEHSLLKC